MKTNSPMKRSLGKGAARPHPAKTQAEMWGQAIPTPAAGSSERGSAVLIILIVISLMLSFMAANSRSLRHLKEEMRLIEQRQLQKYQEGRGIPASTKPAGETNSISGQPVQTPFQPRQP